MGLDISEHIVMLYYKELKEARNFYGNILGLRITMENDWVVLFQVTPQSFIGIVKEDSTDKDGDGGFHKAQETNAVMVSLATTEISKWSEHLKQFDDVHIIKDLYDSTNLPMKAILFTDPGGYSVEFYQWTEKIRQPKPTASPYS